MSSKIEAMMPHDDDDDDDDFVRQCKPGVIGEYLEVKVRMKQKYGSRNDSRCKTSTRPGRLLLDGSRPVT